MTGQAAGTTWRSAYPPPVEPLLAWELTVVAELPDVRADVRRELTADARGSATPDLIDRLVLALDEMASNALRHGGGAVRAAIGSTATAYLIEVSDQAAQTPPTPAVGRDPSFGGLGLYLIAELADEHGWYSWDGHKHVWALLPR
ncbi:ATP-binding protein [Blastococcus saxobsidens]|uniref:Anti-sigma regulatory factor (Ser/Thr protein kinase) n=1 Tax=Blastococcus saxobsidens TaxID=138336 RepID=A0A4Q7YCI3_9ACTN|nr:ATP-binding protein [Blastococcus saxobsidens]RZU33885.1 anti-sigma regulatory factor (Ser/Thr protein kinase) [Blastococcus saxobsidens]